LFPSQESQPSTVPLLTQLPHVPLPDTWSLRTKRLIEVPKDQSGTPEFLLTMQATTQNQVESQVPQDTQSVQRKTSLKEQLEPILQDLQ
jgi:hypothetical protein